MKSGDLHTVGVQCSVCLVALETYSCTWCNLNSNPGVQRTPGPINVQCDRRILRTIKVQEEKEEEGQKGRTSRFSPLCAWLFHLLFLFGPSFTACHLVHRQKTESLRIEQGEAGALSSTPCFFPLAEPQFPQVSETSLNY
jgi:hypothetical protein